MQEPEVQPVDGDHTATPIDPWQELEYLAYYLDGNQDNPTIVAQVIEDATKTFAAYGEPFARFPEFAVAHFLRVLQVVVERHLTGTPC